MAKGDATYARGNVDWHTSPEFRAIPSNNCRVFHETLYRFAVKERSVVLPKKYKVDYLAEIVNSKEQPCTADDIRHYVKQLVDLDLIGVTPDHLLVIYGSRNQHAAMKFKTTEYPEQLATETVMHPDWQWCVFNSPIHPQTPPIHPHTEPNGFSSVSDIDIDIEKEIEIEKETDTGCPETPKASSAPPPAPPAPPVSPVSNPEISNLKSDSTPPLAPSREKPVLVFPCDGKPDTYELTEEKLREYEDTYKTIDVRACLKDARQYILDNPNKRKTHGGMPKFMGNWLRGSINRGQHKKPAHQIRNGATAKQPVETDPFLALCHMLHEKYPSKNNTEIGLMAEANLEALHRKHWTDKSIIQWAIEQQQKHRAQAASKRQPVPDTNAATKDATIDATLKGVVDAVAPIGELKRASALLNDIDPAPPP